MDITTLEIILKIVSFVVGAIVTGLTILAPYLKNSKAKKIAENVIEISQIAQTYIVEAEKFIHFSGAEKKEWVLTKTNQFAIENKIPFDKNLASNTIENIIKLTKQINIREKDINKSATPTIEVVVTNN